MAGFLRAVAKMLASTTPSLRAKGRGGDRLLAVAVHLLKGGTTVTHVGAVHKVGERESNNPLDVWHPWPSKVATVSHLGGVCEFDEQKSTNSIAQNYKELGQYCIIGVLGNRSW